MCLKTLLYPNTFVNMTHPKTLSMDMVANFKPVTYVSSPWGKSTCIDTIEALESPSFATADNLVLSKKRGFCRPFCYFKYGYI